MQYRTITPEQLKKLDYRWKCRVMKEIIKGNVKFVESKQTDADIMKGQEWD